MVNLVDNRGSSPPKMDDNNINANFATEGIDQSGQDNSNKQNNNEEKKVQYTIPGVLHFLQHEWAKFELDRRHWDVERAEFQARISFLRGERKGQENLKNDLVRRIKMLEYALKQERIKNYKLTHGGDDPAIDHIAQPEDNIDDQAVPMDIDAITSQPNSNLSWRQGRQLLRQYLQEIGYTDTILDVRSFRVKSLLGLNDDSGKKSDEYPNKGSSVRVLADTEHSIMAAKDFLTQDIHANKVPQPDMDDSDSDEEITVLEKKLKMKLGDKKDSDGLPLEEQEALGEFQFLSGEEVEREAVKRPAGEWGVDSKALSRMKEEYKKEAADKHKSLDGRKKYDEEHRMEGPEGVDDRMDVLLDMGESVGLRIAGTAPNSTDDIDPMSCDKNLMVDESLRKTWTCKLTLRSHYDSIRAMAFHPVEACLLTASEDATMKLWNLQKGSSPEPSGNKKGATATPELEPVYTFRGHTGAILCLCLSPTGDMCYTGGLDGLIKCWNIPSSYTDMYDPYDPKVCTTLVGHSDAVWSVAFHSSDNRLISASADATVRLWEPGSEQGMLRVFQPPNGEKAPTSVDFVSSDPQQALVAYREPSAAYLLHLESGSVLLRFEWTAEFGVDSGIYQIVSHPTMNITLCAHADRIIRCFDNNTGKLMEQIVAQLDSVTCLSIDPNGLYLLSGSHDGSLRLWNVDNKTCLQEITAHRKKFDESVLCVAFHPSRPMIASAGADGFAKIFV